MSVDEREKVPGLGPKDLAEFYGRLANCVDLSQTLESVADKYDEFWKILKLLVIMSVFTEWKNSVATFAGLSSAQESVFLNGLVKETINDLEDLVSHLLSQAPNTKLGAVTRFIPSIVSRRFLKAVEGGSIWPN